jgi:hypothetical protein
MKIELEKKKKDDAMNKLNQDLAKMKVENLKK